MTRDIETFVKVYRDVFSEQYKSKLIYLYPDAYKNNSEAFLFTDPDNVDAYIIRGRKELISMDNIIIFYKGSGKIEDLGMIPEEEYKNIHKYLLEYEFYNYLVKKIKNVKEPVYFYNSYMLSQYETSNESVEDIMDKKYILDAISEEALRRLNNDGKKFINHVNREASYYAKDAFHYVYTELDFKPIIEIVNNKNFEYALNESIACYDNSLYLAAVSTAGTALENLMVAKLEKENKFNSSENTEIGNLSSRIKNLGYIDRRDKERIMLAAKYRNLAAHANKGRVIKADANVIYQTIFYISGKLFSDK